MRREIVANTLGHSAVTDGVEGHLLYVGSGAESEYEGKDVRGKTTFFFRRPKTERAAQFLAKLSSSAPA